MSYDVFLSYAHIDDETSTPAGEGFVTRLKRYVELEGGIRYGRNRRLKVFQDKDQYSLATGVRWESELFDRLRDSRVFMPIVSRNWATSVWAGEEWENRWDDLQGDFSLGTQTSVFPVAFNMDQEGFDDLPPLAARIKDLQVGYHFSSDMDDADFGRMAKKAMDELGKLLRRLDEVEREESDDPADTRPAVFLGFAFSPQMRRLKRNVRDELRARYRVLGVSDDDGSQTAAQIDGALRETLSKCIAIVHFLDKRPGRMPAGGKKYLLELQRDAGSARAASDPAFKQFFYHGPSIRLDEVKGFDYTSFLAGIRIKDANQPVMKFSERLVKALEAPAPDVWQSPLPGAPKVVVLICDKGDEEAANEIRKYFAEEKQWAVLNPKLDIEPEVEQGKIPGMYEDTFKRYENFLFYWGSGSSSWCPYNYHQLIEARSVDKQRVHSYRDVAAMALYLGRDRQPYKDKYAWPYLKVGDYNHFDPSHLTEFIQRVQDGDVQPAPAPIASTAVGQQ